MIRIHQRSLVGIIRQLAALLAASDQMFTELSDDCRQVVNRSVVLRNKVIKLSSNIDRANNVMRQTRKLDGGIASLSLLLAQLDSICFDVVVVVVEMGN